MSTKRAKEIADIKSGLLSSEEVLVQKALDKMESKGDVSLIPTLISLWAESDSQKIKNKVESLMFGLKDKSALESLIQYIQADVSDEKKWLALNAIWQSGYDASEYLTELIDFALTNSYTNAIDIMTIIDNSEFDETTEDKVDMNLRKLNDFILKNKSESQGVLLEIKSILIDKKIEG
ncbi:hypothetical protein KFE94_13335 [bacterium SCSIO 12643]|nr:hypothetical protein KFE94_13335 [bacterium SCSIO 12643]